MRTLLKNFTLAAAGAALLLPIFASADSPSASIRKVKYTHLSFDKRLVTEDPMIGFEHRYLLHGAIESDEYYRRAGKYYTIFWRAKDRSPNAVVRLEYLQANTGETVHVKEMVVEKVRRHNTTDVNVIGDDYIENGDVIAWKASIVRNGEVISSTKSFLWKD
mgnify:CR=1 FL=1